MQTQEKWQNRWREAKIFEPLVNHAQPKFFFTTPYPYISGSLHIGHGRAVTESDIYVRYQRMKGLNVLYPLAFHITGTPVLGISAAIAKGDQKKIELYKSYVKRYVSDEEEVNEVVESFKDPWNIVKFFIPKMMDEYNSLGLSVDWTRRFTTGDADYQQFITWQFNKYKDNDYLIRGSYPVLYCPHDENAVGEDDIQDADTNPVAKQDFLWVKFRLKNSDLVLMAGTTRPDALYGQTHLWIDPDATYVIVQVNKEKWVVGHAAVKKIEQQYVKPNIIGEVKATELMGKWARGPLVDYDLYIVPAQFIDENVGSGIVYSALEDPVDLFELAKIHDNMDLIRKYHLDEEVVGKLKPISIIQIPGMSENLGAEIGKEMGVISYNDKEKIKLAKDELNKRVFRKGIMKANCGSCFGMRIPEAQVYLKKKLTESNDAVMFYEVSREAYCRCGEKVIVSVLHDQWFLDFNAKGWKEKAQSCLDEMELLPESARKLFEDTFAWLDKRPAARRRGIGTPLPFAKDWIIESLSDSTIYMSFYTIKNIIAKHGVKPEQMSLSFFDYVYLNEGDIKAVSKETKISTKVLQELRESFEYWYPNDHRHTYLAHLSNHLSFFIFAHAGLFPKKNWPKKISLHGFIISEGQKMSKSKGNVISLLEVNEKYGADAFRAYIATAANLEGTFDFKSDDANTVKKTLINLSLLLEESILQQQDGTVSSPFAKAFLSQFESLLYQASRELEQMKLRDYATIVIYHLPNLYKKMQKRVSEKELKVVNKHVTKKWIISLMPLVPHLAEELWELAGNSKHDDFVSLQPWPSFSQNLVDTESEAIAETIEALIADIRHIQKLSTIEQPKEITLVIAEEWKYAFIKELKKQMESTFNPGEIIKRLMQQPGLKLHGKNIAMLVPKLLKDTSKIPKVVLNRKEEIQGLQQALPELTKEFSCKITLVKEEESTNPKAKQAMPGKVAVILM